MLRLPEGREGVLPACLVETAFVFLVAIRASLPRALPAHIPTVF